MRKLFLLFVCVCYAGLFVLQARAAKSVTKKGYCFCPDDIKNSGPVKIFNQTEQPIAIQVFTGGSTEPFIEVKKLAKGFCVCVAVGTASGTPNEIDKLIVAYDGREYTFADQTVLNHYQPKYLENFKKAKRGARSAKFKDDLPERKFIVLDLHDGNPPPEARDANWETMKNRLSTEGINITGDQLALVNYHQFVFEPSARIQVLPIS